MKKFLILLMTAAMLLSLCSCGLFGKDEETELPPEAPSDDPVFNTSNDPIPDILPTIPDGIDPDALDRSDDLVPYKMAIVGEASGTSATTEGFVDLMAFDEEHDMTGQTYYTTTFAVLFSHEAGFSLHAVHLVDAEGQDLFGPYIPDNYPKFAREYRCQIPTDEAIAAKADLFATGYPFFSPTECDTVLTVVLASLEPIDLSEYGIAVEGTDYAAGEEVMQKLTVNSTMSAFNTTPRVVTGSALVRIGSSYYLHNANQLTGGDNGEDFFSRPIHLQNVSNPFMESGDLDHVSFAYFNLEAQNGVSFEQVNLPNGAEYLAECMPSGTNYQDLWLGIICQPGQIDQIRMSVLQKPGLYLIGDYPTIFVNG